MLSSFSVYLSSCGGRLTPKDERPNRRIADMLAALNKRGIQAKQDTRWR